MDIEFDAAAAPSSRPTKQITPDVDKKLKLILQQFQ